MPSRSTFKYLTAPTAVFYINVQNLNKMNENEKKELNACIENAEAVQEFLTEWYSVAELFETSANAASVMLTSVIGQLAPEEKKWLTDLLDQHVMMTNLLKKFEKGGQV